MKRCLSIYLLLLSINVLSQEQGFFNKMILFDYSVQRPVAKMADNFGINSSMGLCYLNNKNDVLFGIDANFMFGNNVKNDSILRLISTHAGYLINSSGELDEVLLYQRGINTHLLIGTSFRSEEDNLSGLYVYGGVGYLQHKIRLETDRTYLPQLENDYMKGYDNFTSGLSTKVCVDYMYFDKNTSIKYHVGFEFINAFTSNKRSYNFSDMHEVDNMTKLDQLLGFRLGVIIPINRDNQGKFHYF